MGVLISMVAFGAGPMSESPIHAPRWVIGVAGVLFASCSVVLVAPESRCSRYLASDYSYPQSIEARIIESLGGIWSPYTGRTFASRRETDIEHIVARSEAHDSGLCAATAATRRRFATDLQSDAVSRMDALLGTN